MSRGWRYQRIAEIDLQGRRLDELGQDGWELMAVLPRQNVWDTIYVFKYTELIIVEATKEFIKLTCSGPKGYEMILRMDAIVCYGNMADGTSWIEYAAPNTPAKIVEVQETTGFIMHQLGH